MMGGLGKQGVECWENPEATIRQLVLEYWDRATRTLEFGWIWTADREFHHWKKCAGIWEM
jgi:hypothetical protein